MCFLFRQGYGAVGYDEGSDHSTKLPDDVVEYWTSAPCFGSPSRQASSHAVGRGTLNKNLKKNK